MLAFLTEVGEPRSTWALVQQLPPPTRGRYRFYSTDEIGAACRALKWRGLVVRVAPSTYAIVPPPSGETVSTDLGSQEDL